MRRLVIQQINEDGLDEAQQQEHKQFYQPEIRQLEGQPHQQQYTPNRL